MSNNTQMNNQYLEKKLIQEDFAETALMLLGFIPVIGEVADIILIIKYLREGKYLYAGLMLIALIPSVGDLIAKPFIYLLRGSKAGKLALRSEDDLYKYLVETPAAMKIYKKFGTHINDPRIGKTINKIEKSKKFGPDVANGLRETLNQHAGVLSKIFNKPIDISKSIGREIAKNEGGLIKTITGRGPVSMGIKNYFRGNRLAKYIEKNGKAPSNWLNNWYNIVYLGSIDRKQYVKNFISANNLLAVFGLPSLSAFENKFENDENFRNMLANNEKFTNLVGQTTSPEDLKMIERNTPEIPSLVGSEFGKMMGFGLMKKIAQSFT